MKIHAITLLSISALTLGACNERTATLPQVDQETLGTIGDVKKIMTGENVTFGDLMGVAQAVGAPENLKKLACAGMSAGAAANAGAMQTGQVKNTQQGTLLGYMTDMAVEILPTIKDVEVSTVAIQGALKPVYAECMRYSMAVIQGEAAFQVGNYEAK